MRGLKCWQIEKGSLLFVRQTLPKTHALQAVLTFTTTHTVHVRSVHLELFGCPMGGAYLYLCSLILSGESRTQQVLFVQG